MFNFYFPLSFRKCNKPVPKKKKCNKLDEYIYNYLFIILVPLNNFSIKKNVVGVIKKNKNLDHISLRSKIGGDL